MEEFHSLLKRQLKRYIKNIDHLPEDVQRFLTYVSEAYRNFDDDRLMLERSLELSSDELLTANLELRALFGSLPDLIFLVNMQGIIIDCQGGFDSDLVYPREFYKGRNILNFSDREIREKFSECFHEVYLNKKNISTDYSLNINGEEKFYEARFLNLENKQILIVVKDLTQRIKTEETLKKNYLQITKKSIFESIISTISQSVHNSLSVKDIMELAVEAVYNRIDNVDFVGIYEIVKTKAKLKSHRGYPEWFIKKVEEIDFPKGVTWYCINNNKTIHVDNIKDDKYLGDAGKKVGTNSYVASPIFIHGNAIGCIHIHSKTLMLLITTK